MEPQSKVSEAFPASIMMEAQNALRSSILTRLVTRKYFIADTKPIFQLILNLSSEVYWLLTNTLQEAYKSDYQDNQRQTWWRGREGGLSSYSLVSVMAMSGV
jgi:hypothetical protein